MKTEVADVSITLDISVVEHAPGLKKNLLSFVRLERNGLVYEGKRRYLADVSTKVAEIIESRNLLVVRFKAIDRLANASLFCNVLADQ
jgi:hypothetical protein